MQSLDNSSWPAAKLSSQALLGSNRNAPALHLVVTNHAGVMTQVCGLFSRRGYNLAAMICLAGADGQRHLWLEVPERERLEQIVRQLSKLHDVRGVTVHDYGHHVFAAVAQVVGPLV
jgi:acetolactate synthase I/III small subunit